LPLIIIGSLTLLALVLYQSAELWNRLRLAWADLTQRRKTQTAP
jgi:hypothetical protein